MGGPELTDAKRKLLDCLKRCGPITAGNLSARLHLTSVAVRQHLLGLERLGMVGQKRTSPRGRGRPAVLWSLTALSEGVFPGRHAELTVALIDATRRALGPEGLLRVIEVRSTDQVKAYRKSLPHRSADLKQRVDALARIRSREDYMAEVVEEASGALLLIEHHCPVCEAARCCTGLCDSELIVFQEVLGDDAIVERVEHMVSGDPRCVYRIRKNTDPTSGSFESRAPARGHSVMSNGAERPFNG